MFGKQINMNATGGGSYCHQFEIFPVDGGILRLHTKLYFLGHKQIEILHFELPCGFSQTRTESRNGEELKRATLSYPHRRKDYTIW